MLLQDKYGQVVSPLDSIRSSRFCVVLYQPKAGFVSWKYQVQLSCQMCEWPTVFSSKLGFLRKLGPVCHVLHYVAGCLSLSTCTVGGEGWKVGCSIFHLWAGTVHRVPWCQYLVLATNETLQFLNHVESCWPIVSSQGWGAWHDFILSSCERGQLTYWLTR